MTDATKSKSGGCLCGAVRFDVTGPLRDIILCHCTMCQKTGGHHFAATAALTADLDIKPSGSLKWFKSSNHAKRGFCADCGSSLFWEMVGRDSTSIMAGSFDEDIDLPVTAQVFMADRKSYYTPDATIPAYDTYPKGS